MNRAEVTSADVATTIGAGRSTKTLHLRLVEANARSEAVPILLDVWNLRRTTESREQQLLYPSELSTFKHDSLEKSDYQVHRVYIQDVNLHHYDTLTSKSASPALTSTAPSCETDTFYAKRNKAEDVSSKVGVQKLSAHHKFIFWFSSITQLENQNKFTNKNEGVRKPSTTAPQKPLEMLHHIGERYKPLLITIENNIGEPDREGEGKAVKNIQT